MKLVAVALLVACGSKPEQPTGEPERPSVRDAAPPTLDAGDATVSSAPRARADAIAPVLTVGGRRFVDVALWFELPAPAKGVDISTWGDGEVESVQIGVSPTALP